MGQKQRRAEGPVKRGFIGEMRIELHFEEKIYTIENVRRNSVWEKFKDLLNNW